MPILTSPSVVVTEKDYSQVVTFAPTGEGAIVGNFAVGPVLQPILVSSVTDLETIFGRPTESNYKEWFTAYNFLQYSSKLWVTRVKADDVMNAVTTPAASIIKGDWSATVAYNLGDIVRGSNGKWYRATITDADMGDDPTVAGGSGAADNGWALLGIEMLNQEDYDTTSSVDLTAAGTWICKHPGNIGNNLEIITVDEDTWATLDTDSYKSEGRRVAAYIKAGKPTTTQFVETNYGTGKSDEMHVVVIDKTGLITGVAGKILEVHESLSKASDASDYQGRSLYYANYINNYSNWIYFSSHTSAVTSGADEVAWGVTGSYVAGATKTFKTLTALQVNTLIGGNDGDLSGAALDSALEEAYDLYRDKEGINISFLMTVDYPAAVQQYVIESIAEPRRDCLVFVSPHDSSAPFLDKTTIVSDLLTFRDTTLNINSSFAVMDSGYKYQFDGYNQKYRWVPLNGDVAGICARLDSEYDPWISPAGFTRGIVKNARKLSSVLNQAARDQLYPKGVNAVVSFTGKGTVLFGDRTMQSKTSAFQTIHIRRLFIILEKAIEEAAKYALFELNNEVTRNNFVGMIRGFLTTVQARDGLDDFMVVCDKTNNTDEVIARGEFIADIYIKPLYSIQYIILNFIATKSVVQFNQLIK